MNTECFTKIIEDFSRFKTSYDNFSFAYVKKVNKYDGFKNRYDKYSTSGRRVKVNVGGEVFEVLYDTLVLSPKILQIINESVDHNNIFIDRNPKYFEIILLYLRHCKVTISRENSSLVSNMLEEAEFYEVLCIYKFLVT